MPHLLPGLGRAWGWGGGGEGAQAGPPSGPSFIQHSLSTAATLKLSSSIRAVTGLPHVGERADVTSGLQTPVKGMQADGPGCFLSGKVLPLRGGFSEYTSQGPSCAFSSQT